jgi:hypothetical protein
MKVDHFLIRLYTNLARGVELRAYANPPISYLRRILGTCGVLLPTSSS